MAASKTITYDWKDPTRLARLVIAALWLDIGIHSLSVLVNLAVQGAGYYSGGEPVLSPQQLIRAAADALFLLAFVALISVPFWVVRVSHNAHVFKPSMRFSRTASIGWYIVPFANFVLPYQAMSEIWEVSDTREGGKRADRVLNWWWGVWLLGLFVGTFVTVMDRAATGGYREDEAQIYALVTSVGNLVSIALCLLFMTVVRRITRMQVAKNHIRAFDEADGARRDVLSQVAG